MHRLELDSVENVQFNEISRQIPGLNGKILNSRNARMYSDQNLYDPCPETTEGQRNE